MLLLWFVAVNVVVNVVDAVVAVADVVAVVSMFRTVIVSGYCCCCY